ncbi:MAG: hypothetical protein ACLQEQ_04990 [Nitrososphaerales archaeon]
MDPLILLDQAVAQEKVPRALARKVRLRMSLVQHSVERVEKASGLHYPPYYIEPTLPVSKGGGEYGQMGVFFARVIPTTATGSLTILIQFTAALVAHGTKGTLDAVAAHEFTHYVELVRKLARTNIVSDEAATSLYEASFADSERTVPAKLLYSDSALVGLLTRKFKPELSDPALNKKVGEAWIAKGLPTRWVGPEANRVRLEMGVIAGARFDPAVVRKASEIEEKMKV